MITDDCRPSRRLVSAFGRQRADLRFCACYIEETAYDSYESEITRFVGIAVSCCSTYEIGQRSEGSTTRRDRCQIPHHDWIKQR